MDTEGKIETSITISSRSLRTLLEKCIDKYFIGKRIIFLANPELGKKETKRGRNKKGL